MAASSSACCFACATPRFACATASFSCASETAFDAFVLATDAIADASWFCACVTDTWFWRRSAGVAPSSVCCRLASADASCASAVRTEEAALASSIRASGCPFLTVSPAFTRIAVTVPFVWKLTPKLFAACTFPLADTDDSTEPRCTADVRTDACAVPDDVSSTVSHVTTAAAAAAATSRTFITRFRVIHDSSSVSATNGTATS